MRDGSDHPPSSSIDNLCPTAVEIWAWLLWLYFPVQFDFRICGWISSSPYVCQIGNRLLDHSSFLPDPGGSFWMRWGVEDCRHLGFVTSLPAAILDLWRHFRSPSWISGHVTSVLPDPGETIWSYCGLCGSPPSWICDVTSGRHLGFVTSLPAAILDFRSRDFRSFCGHVTSG